MLPNLFEVGELLCRTHWKQRFTHQTPPELTNVLLCIQIFCNMNKEEYFFATVDSKGNYVDAYWKDDSVSLTETEIPAVRKYRCVAQGPIFGYRISEWSCATVLVSNERKVKVYAYRIGAKQAPLCNVPNGFLTEAARTYLVDRGEYFWINKETISKAYPKSVQGGSNLRHKTHINASYHTTKNRQLSQCSLDFKKAFPGVQNQTLIKEVCADLAHLAAAAGIPYEQYSFLTGDMSLESGIVFLFATYNGGGIYSHIDESFCGPVFVIVLGIKERAPHKSQGKIISFGQVGNKSCNGYAELQNKQYSMYFFYGYFTDFAYHGVPKMAGYTCTVFIVRARR